jgi:hypothetical protein
MRILKSFAPLALIAMATAVSGYADVVITGGTFVDLVGPFNGTGTTFFDNVSDDNLYTDPGGVKIAECNIGALLTGQTAEGDCRNLAGTLTGVPTGNSTWQYLVSGTGTSTPFTFQAGALTTGADVTLLVEFAGRKDVNEFGYYKLDENGNPVDVKLFSGSDTGQITTSFLLNASEVYGFYMRTPETEADPNISLFRTGEADRHGRVMLFRNTFGKDGSDLSVDSFLVAFEDGTDWDYQDGLLFVTVVPEPGTVIVLSGALLGTLAMVRRRRQQKA